nr:MAG TPA: hypothetical protein [Caudoviricetes sp.]
MSIRTVRSVIEAEPKTKEAQSVRASNFNGNVFQLNQANTTSQVVDVLNTPKRLIAWSIAPGDKVKVMMVRLGNTGSDSWSKSEDCCVGPQPPGDVVVIGQLPYVRCGVQVVLTDQSPTAVIDDAGHYMFLYESEKGDTAVVEAYDDFVKRKTC